jgi:hypothetical protein
VQTTHGYQSADLERIGQALAAVGGLLELN